MQPRCLSTCSLSPADWHLASSQSAAFACRHGYERELLSLLSQLVRDMNRKIEKQKERAVLESGARQLTMEDRARLEAIKVRGMLGAAGPSCPACPSCGLSLYVNIVAPPGWLEAIKVWGVCVVTIPDVVFSHLANFWHGFYLRRLKASNVVRHCGAPTAERLG